MNPVQSFKIPLNWRPVLIAGTAFPWHRDSPKPWRDRELIEGPRVYRWTFKNKTCDIEAVYIGQSEKFQNRLASYRKPRKATPNSTDVILNKMFESWEQKGRAVELQFLEIAAFEINGQLIDSSTKSLRNHEVRLLLECLAIVTAKSEKPKLLNRLSKNVHEKDLKNLLLSLSPKQQQEILTTLRQTNNQAREINATQK
jgi:hypothetical protein